MALISLWVLISPTYCLFYSLDEADIFRRPHWENPDQEGLLADTPDPQEELIGSGWSMNVFIFAERKEFSRFIPALFLPLLAIERGPVLRC